MFHIASAVLAASLLIQVQSAGDPSGHAGERQVVFLNNTRVPVVEIYVSDDNRYVRDDKREDWQQDLLGSEFLLPDNSVSLYINDQNGNCRVDLKVVFDNGATFVSRSLNICFSENKTIPIR